MHQQLYFAFFEDLPAILSTPLFGRGDGASPTVVTGHGFSRVGSVNVGNEPGPCDSEPVEAD